MSENTTKYGIFMHADRSVYGPDQIRRPKTIGELIEDLEELAQENGYETPVFFEHDNGYTYGTPGNLGNGIYVGEYDETGHVEIDW